MPTTPRTRYLTDKGRALIGLTVLVLAVVLVASIVARPASVPKFRMVAQHGSILSIVVDEKVAADDAALLRIADSLVPRFHLPMLVLHVWTDGRMVPYEILDMTAAQLAARRAMVEVDVNRDVRKVERRP
jgi:hypothetical protein